MFGFWPCCLCCFLCAFSLACCFSVLFLCSFHVIFVQFGAFSVYECIVALPFALFLT